MTEASNQLQPGEVVASRFRVVRMLGSGGYGEVYLAEQTSVGRQVALKVLHQEAVGMEARMAERFNLEARQTCKLQHPNTVVIHDFGQDQERRLLFLAMEFLEGASLKELMKERGPLDVDTALKIVEQIAGSLQEAHDVGIVHRDLKPANVMLTERAGDREFVKVIDFGIAKAVRDESGPRLTETGVLLGTPYYMAPEQAGSDTLDHRVDIYALAVMTFQLLTGEVPFSGKTAIEVLKKHVLQPPPSIFDVQPSAAIPPAVDAWLQRSMAKDPAARPGSMKDFVAGLERAVSADDGPTMDSPVVAHSSPAVKVGTGALESHERATTQMPIAHGGATPNPQPHYSSPDMNTAAIPSSGSRKGLWIGLAALLLAVIAGVVVAVSFAGGDDNADAATNPDDSAERGTEPDNDPTPLDSQSQGTKPEEAGADNGDPLTAQGNSAHGASTATSPALAEAQPNGDGTQGTEPSSGDSAAANPGQTTDESAGGEEEPPETAQADERDADSKRKTSERDDDARSDDREEEDEEEEKSRRSRKVECQVIVIPWGTALVDGSRMKQRGETGYFSGRRGKRYELELEQNGSRVARKKFEVPESGECRVKLRAR